MFNKTVCTSGAAAGSVARELKIVHGILMSTDETNDEINIIDTMVMHMLDYFFVI